MQHLDSPVQVVSLAEYRRRRETDYAGGTLEAPTTLYLEPASGATVLGPALILEPWSFEDARREAAISRRELLGDSSHRVGCSSGLYRDFERASCSTCAVLGWGAHSDAWHGLPAPNYAAWERVYVQAREPIPRGWLPAFMHSLNGRDDNVRYAEGLRRDLATWGVRVTSEAGGYKLPVPTEATMLRYLFDRHGPDDRPAILAELLEVAHDNDGEYETAGRRLAVKLAPRFEGVAARG